MYAAIRTYKVSDSGEVSRRAEDGFVPLVREAEGFVAYGIVDGGDGTIASISVFEDQAGAQASTEKAADWVRENLAELVEGAPQVLSGEVTVSARGS